MTDAVLNVGKHPKPLRRQARPETTRMFVTAAPGLARIVSSELESLPGVSVTGRGFDSRSDVVLFEAERDHHSQLWSARTIEDLFVEVGRTFRAEGDRPYWIAGRIWRPERVQRALSVWSEGGHRLVRSMTFRVVARVLQEKSFLRTDLRRTLSQVISNDKVMWKIADPAQIEVWVGEYARGRLLAGIRLSDSRMRQHHGRKAERAGALRPTVAAAMVRLAGSDDGGRLLDPCCGSGTILAEARAQGWDIEGRDVDPAAVGIARRNVPDASITTGDARRLDLAEVSVDACVSNLPFGRQYNVQGEISAWLLVVLAEIARVTRAGGKIVLLAPEVPAAVLPAKMRMRASYPIRLLGVKTNIWVYDRI